MFFPKISVIMPVYNGSDYLREAIDSVVSQSYKNIEIIVVNDGSNDNGKTESIILSFGDKVKYFKKDNGGVASALNIGIQNMTGDYFSWLSHDDLYLPNKIELQVSLLRNLDDKSTILYGGYLLINETADVTGSMRPDLIHPLNKLNYSLFAILRGVINGCTLLIHKDHFLKYGFFDESLKTTQDYALWFKMFRHESLLFHHELLVKTRIHDERGTFKISNHLEECNDLWVGFMDELTISEMSKIEDSPFLFYIKTAEFLKQTPYDKAEIYARDKACKLLKETKITVIMPFFNRSCLTAEAIDSVIQQSHKNFELIVVDDGSTEDIGKVIEKCESDKRATYYRQENMGPSAARNYGISLSSGDYIAFLDSDDLFQKQKLEKQLFQMKSNNSVFSHTSYLRTPFSGGGHKQVNSGSFSGRVFPRILSSCGIALPTVMMDRKILDGFKFNEGLSIGEDVCSWIDLAYKYDFLGIEDYLTIVRTGPETAAYNEEKIKDGLFNIISHIKNNNEYKTKTCNYHMYLLINDWANLYLKTSSIENENSKQLVNNINKKENNIINEEKIHENYDINRIAYKYRFEIMKNKTLYSLKNDGIVVTVSKIIKKIYVKFNGYSC